LRSEKEKRIISLKKEGRTVREIAQETKSSFGKIALVSKEAEDEERTAAEKWNKQQEKEQFDQKYTHALELFDNGKKNIEVAILTGLNANEVISCQKDYGRLIGADKLAIIFDQIEPNLMSLIELEEKIRQEHLNKDDVDWMLKHCKEVRSLKEKLDQARAQLHHIYTEILKARDGLNAFDQKKRQVWGGIVKLKQQKADYLRILEPYAHRLGGSLSNEQGENNGMGS
jgi:hypothetical protein